jgi:hypothetical protein
MMKQVRLAASASLFVAALLTSAALIFIFGALGLRGSSIITGGYLLVTVVSAFLLGRGKDESFTVTSMDLVFSIFAAAVAIASFLHFDESDYKEYVLLVLDTMFAYVAGRALSNSVIGSIRLRLLQISTPLLVAACVATIPNLVDEIYPRPFVFGFIHAATVFSVAFGYMVIAYIYSEIEARSKISLLYFALTVIAIAVFVAATVRFVLIAILATMLFSVACSFYRPLKIWRRVSLILLAMILGAVIGTFSRYAFVVRASDQLAATGAFSGEAKPGQNVVRVERSELLTPKIDLPVTPPSCNTLYDLNNSIAVRRALLSDALSFLPKAGFFGFGLDSFSKMSCFEGYQIHNSVLQAAIELGWVAGIALMVLLAFPLIHFSISQHEFDVNLQFLLSCIAYATSLSLVHGQFSRELPLFLFLGAFAKASSNLSSKNGRQGFSSVLEPWSIPK